MKILLAVASCVLLLSGCGAVSQGAQCTSALQMSVGPATGTADHAAPAPGNQQVFTAFTGEKPQVGCPISNVVLEVFPAWTSSDPLDITISSANDKTNGTATCTGSTNGPVTLTAVLGSGASELTATASLTCK
jgi:hypothetical protein